MKCPFCRDLENKVIDSRLGKEGDIIRRRRECLRCQRRFTTYERVEEVLPMLVKKDGRREAYDRRKVIDGLTKACQKRLVSTEAIEAIGDRVERVVQEQGTKEVPAAVVGEAVMSELYDLDKVAYVRFASVYRSFRDVDEFLHELKEVIRVPKTRTPKKRRPRKKPAQ